MWKKLLDSLVQALSTAIDERSHYNANHTRNMVKMAEAFLDWKEKNGNPWDYDEIRRRAFIMSGVPRYKSPERWRFFPAGYRGPGRLNGPAGRTWCCQ